MLSELKCFLVFFAIVAFFIMIVLVFGTVISQEIMADNTLRILAWAGVLGTICALLALWIQSVQFKEAKRKVVAALFLSGKSATDPLRL